jgi:dCMP deaminase
MSKKVAIAYIPVLHKGYLDFLSELVAQGVQELFLIGDSILESHDELDYINRKDRLRALPIETVVTALSAVTELTVTELSPEMIIQIQAGEISIVTPREDIGEVIVQAYFQDVETEYKNVFIRRNKHMLRDEKMPDTHKVISMDELTTKLWADVLVESQKSADWYRQVGAALVKDGQVVYLTHNEHMPEEQTPNIEGDARTLFKRGIRLEYSTAAHAEVVAIGSAAKHGVVTSGAELYMTDFPCPYCARLIVSAGIAKVYFLRGYAVLEGDAFLKEAGVEVIKVEEAK